mmetsp:Transcript_14468/g.18896  ORF Transcript_14468/g.18896 Transcript_14468/m.18896 type:complete len:148 (+) Transcript_14468:170-613(+)|eukprot:CAMPEP_0198139472 /NCGR_PEP_ID=MMETSP1443-20131203/2756_1 /TAXON_ID=186043 /ORGANISM="Entomoneis sp., Strain CCMP2396" /LENGTH=147 /DNA_ID=CAMNT_0043801597 /DNA_START=248 /DNA_END=691 /DNA_ORIENTATION=-
MSLNDNNINNYNKNSLFQPRSKFLVAVSFLVAVALFVLVGTFVITNDNNNNDKSPLTREQANPAVSVLNNIDNAPQNPTATMPKTSWPELVGMPGEQARLIIVQENPSIKQVDLIPEDSMVTMDYREDRVRIFVKEDGTVASIPQHG